MLRGYENIPRGPIVYKIVRTGNGAQRTEHSKGSTTEYIPPNINEKL